MSKESLFDNNMETKEWAGKKLYQCKKCKWNSIDLNLANNHIASHILGKLKDTKVAPKETVTLDTNDTRSIQAEEKIEKVKPKKKRTTKKKSEGKET